MKQFGPYQIISELGRGGMAVVYRALQPSVNRIVALKVLPSSAEGDTESLRRFQREAETAANLNHENIVKVWEASVDSPPYYIALEFLEGGTLAERLQRGPLALDEALTIATKLCSALGHAHDRGVVHRDVKPANIMFDSAGRPVVTDFGIARTTDRTQLTAPGSKFGTPNYMSPEQAKGLPADCRTDVYSAGAVLYEMLNGNPPFAGDDPLPVMYRIVNDEPTPPSALNPALPRTLDALIMRALDKDPRKRYHTGSEMAAALSSMARSTAVVPPTVHVVTAPSPGMPSSPPQTKRKRKHRALLLAASAAFAAAASGIVYLAVREPAADVPPAGGLRPARVQVADGWSSPQSYQDQETGDLGAAPEALPTSLSSDGSDSPLPPDGDEPQTDQADPVEAADQGGAEPTLPKVPTVIGKPQDEAAKALNDAGFVARSTTAASTTVPKGRVVSQQPAGDSDQASGATVSLIISSGRPPQPASTPRKAAPRAARRPPKSTQGGGSTTASGTSEKSPSPSSGSQSTDREVLPP